MNCFCLSILIKSRRAKGKDCMPIVEEHSIFVKHEITEDNDGAMSEWATPSFIIKAQDNKFIYHQRVDKLLQELQQLKNKNQSEWRLLQLDYGNDLLEWKGVADTTSQLVWWGAVGVIMVILVRWYFSLLKLNSLN